jgi:hypothetical protein
LRRALAFLQIFWEVRRHLMRVRSALFFAPCLVVVGLFAACNRQGEGQVCDPRAANNGDSDCQSGLTCQTIPGAANATCCPPNLAQATMAACGVNHALLDANTAPPDGSQQGGGGDDGALESSVEASAEAAIDAATADAAAQGDSDSAPAEGGD